MFWGVGGGGGGAPGDERFEAVPVYAQRYIKYRRRGKIVQLQAECIMYSDETELVLFQIIP